MFQGVYCVTRRIFGSSSDLSKLLFEDIRTLRASAKHDDETGMTLRYTNEF